MLHKKAAVADKRIQSPHHVDVNPGLSIDFVTSPVVERNGSFSTEISLRSLFASEFFGDKFITNEYVGFDRWYV